MVLVLSAALSKESVTDEGRFYLLMCLAEADKWRLNQSMSYW